MLALIVVFCTDSACRNVSADAEATPILCGRQMLLLTLSSKLFLFFSDSSELVLAFVLVLLRLLLRRRCRR